MKWSLLSVGNSYSLYVPTWFQFPAPAHRRRCGRAQRLTEGVETAATLLIFTVLKDRDFKSLPEPVHEQSSSYDVLTMTKMACRCLQHWQALSAKNVTVGGEWYISAAPLGRGAGLLPYVICGGRASVTQSKDITESSPSLLPREYSIYLTFSFLSSSASVLLFFI